MLGEIIQITFQSGNFRTLKATISRQLVNFGMTQLIIVLTIQTQRFYENYKNFNRVHSTNYITISTNLSSSSSSSSSVSEIMDCKYDEEEKVFIVDGTSSSTRTCDTTPNF